MALNFSRRPIFVPHDISDLLPSDPFDMTKTNAGATLTAPTGRRFEDFDADRSGYGIGDVGIGMTSNADYQWWFGNFDADRMGYGMGDLGIGTTSNADYQWWFKDFDADRGGYGTGDMGIRTTSNADYQWCAGLNFIWNNAMGLGFQPFPSNNIWSNRSFSLVCCDVSSSEVSSKDDMCETSVSYQSIEALPFALGYLGLRDLLAAGSVCRSLRSTVVGDPLLWRSIHIGQPLNQKITDEVLLELSRRAQGNLKSLILMNCLKITEGCLKQVLNLNPKLTKLCVPGCTKIGIDTLVDTLKAFNSVKGQGIEHLRIGGLFGTTKVHLEECMMLLGTNSWVQNNAQRPTYYHNRNLHLPYDDNRILDIELCPKCENVRIVFDCPGEECQDKLLGGADNVCRACIHCIPRCFQCGCCINVREHEENFSLDIICLNCLTPVAGNDHASLGG